jgi:4-hydroxybenzoate polyprenyltransferase
MQYFEAKTNCYRYQKRSTIFHLNTIWLITVNDLKSIVAPETAFGICSALAVSLTTNPSPQFIPIISRLPHVILWNWLNVLLFDIANQRLPNSIVEDRVNKPWRAIPTGRLNEIEARRLLLGVLPVVFFASLWLGGVVETVALMVLTWMYNDLGAADEVYVVRNFVNALGFMCYSAGSLNVAAGDYALTPKAYTWLIVIGLIIFSTLSMQDLPDVEGDTVRGRMTAPIVHGDIIARYTIALPIFCWSLYCPYFFQAILFGYTSSITIGGYLAFRILYNRGISSDKISWKLWCVWTMVLYALPLMC